MVDAFDGETVMKTSILLILLIATLAMPKASQADEFAATACPPMSIAQDSSAPPNLAKNPDFDKLYSRELSFARIRSGRLENAPQQ